MSKEYREYNKILDLIEDDYVQDLSIHLYSTFLLHRVDPFFPARKWSAWPLLKSDVPDPSNSKLYTDIVAKEEYQDNNHLIQAEANLFGKSSRRLQLKKISRNTKDQEHEQDENEGEDQDRDRDENRDQEEHEINSENNKIDEPFNKPNNFESSDDESDDNSDDNSTEDNSSDDSSDDSSGELRSKTQLNPEDFSIEEEEEEREKETAARKMDRLKAEGAFMKSEPVEFKEKITNPRAALLNEIHSMVEHKIHKLFKQSSDNEALIPSSDIMNKTTSEISKKIANKVSKLTNTMMYMDSRRLNALNIKIPRRIKLYDWQDILLVNLESDESRRKTIDIAKHSELYDKCHRLFVSPIDHRYKYGDLFPQNVQSNIESSEISNDGKGESEISENNNLSKPFNHVDYLNASSQVVGAARMGGDYVEAALERFKDCKKIRDYKRNLFLRKLKLQNKLNNLTYDVNDIPKSTLDLNNTNNSMMRELENQNNTEMEKLPIRARSTKKRKIYVAQDEHMKIIRTKALNRGSIQLVMEDYLSNV